MPKLPVNKIKNQLVKEKKRLEKEVSAFAKKGQRGFHVFFKNFGSKDDEHVASVAAMDKNISIEKSLEKSLREVDHALKKIEQGKYGVCEVCGKKIEAQRLKILPTATVCIKCGKARKN